MSFRIFFMALSFSLIAFPVKGEADDQRACKYTDYDYTPHADYLSDQTPRNIKMRPQANPDPEMTGTEIKAYHLFEIVNSEKGQTKSTIQIPLVCKNLKVIHCQMDLQSAYDLREGMIDVGIIKNFSSGSMEKRVPYAIFMSGLTAATQNPRTPSEFVPCCVPSDAVHFKALPSLWIADKKINDCMERPE